MERPFLASALADDGTEDDVLSADGESIELREKLLESDAASPVPVRATFHVCPNANVACKNGLLPASFERTGGIAHPDASTDDVPYSLGFKFPGLPHQYRYR